MDHLHGEFDAEPGRGEERSEHLRSRRIRTYLVVFDHPRKVSVDRKKVNNICSLLYFVYYYYYYYISVIVIYLYIVMMISSCKV